MDYHVDWMDYNKELHECMFATENEAIAFAFGLSEGRNYEEVTPYCDNTLIRFESFNHQEFITAYHKGAYK